jgi:hypothetical protein
MARWAGRHGSNCVVGAEGCGYAGLILIMNDQKKPTFQERSYWVVLITAALGAMTGALLTAGAFLYQFIQKEHQISYTLYLIVLPSHYIWKIFGYDPLEYHGSPSAFFVDWFLLPLLTNSLLLFLLGIFVGLILCTFRRKSNNEPGA